MDIDRKDFLNEIFLDFFSGILQDTWKYFKFIYFLKLTKIQF